MDSIHLERFSRSERWLLIDMHSGPGKGYELVIEVNGERLKEYRSGLQGPVDKFDHYHRTYRQRILVQGRAPEDVQQWFEIPIDLSLFPITDRLVVDVHLVPVSEGSPSYVDVNGDYRATSDRAFEGPSFALSPRETSLYKWVYDDDFRLDTQLPLSSPRSSSSFYDGSRWSHADLSPGIGLQSGEFRIRLLLVAEDGAVIVL